MATGGPGGPNLGVGKGGGPTVRSFKLAPITSPTLTILTPPVITTVWRSPLYTNPRGPEYHVSLRSWAGIKTSTGILVGDLPPGVFLTDLPLKLPYEYHIGLRTFAWNQTLTLPTPPDLGAKTFRGPLYTTPRSPEYHVLLRSWFGRLPPAGVLAPFAQDDWPVPKGYVYPLDIRTIVASYNQNLIGQDVFPPGERITDLTVKPYEYRNQLHHWSWSYNLNLIGKDKLPVGKELTDLVPRPYTQPIDIRTITASYNLNLVGQDLFPAGETSTALARGYEHHIQLRTWTWQYNPNLVGQDFLPPGKDIFDLARGPDYAISLRTWFGAIPPVVVTFPFFQTDWPNPRGYPSDVRTITASYNPNLVGQDLFPPGERALDLPAPRDYHIQLRTWFGALPPPTVVTFPFFETDWPLPRGSEYPASLRSLTGRVTSFLMVPFSQEDWPTLREFRQIRSWTWQYNVNLIGQDVIPGKIVTERPALSPALLQTWINQVNLALTTVTVQNPFAKYDWPLTSGPQQPDRALVAFYNPNLIGQDKLPFSQDYWPLTPAMIREANLSTWISQVKLLLAVPFNQTDWQLPKPQPPAARTWTWSYNLNLIGQDQLPTGAEVTALPPQPALSAIQLRNWINTTSLALLAGPQVRPFYQTDWPINIGPRQPTPVFTASYNKNLIGQDQLPTGESITWLPQQPLFANQLRTWIQTVNLALQSKVFQLPFNQYDWPLPRAPYRPLPEYSKAFKLPLIGLDVLPFNQKDWPTPAQKIRPLDLLTWINQVSQVLIAPHRQKDWPTPIGYQQPANSYTFSYNLNLIGKDALPIRQQYWPLTPDVRRYIDFAVSTNPNILTPPAVISYIFRQPFYTPPRGHIYPSLMRSITAGINLALKFPPAPLPKNQYSWPLPRAHTPGYEQRYTIAYQGGSLLPISDVGPIPPPPDPTPPEDVRLIYNAGNEWQMLDRIREPGPVGWR